MDECAAGPDRCTVQINRLHSGGFGTTFSAAVARNGIVSNVVAKRVQLHTSEEKAKFDGEVHLLGKVCAHPSIINVCGSALLQIHGMCFGLLLMEHAPGGDTLDWLLKHGPLSEGATRDACHPRRGSLSASFFRHICTGEATTCLSDAINALVHCHRLGVVHRDIKLENLLLRGTTIDEGILVADFGLAREQSHTAQLFHDVAGTAAYRAPEVGAAGSCPRKADVWSLGVVLFAWCHGRIPVREASASCPRFVWLQEQQAAGAKACDAIYSFDSSSFPVRPTLRALRPLLDAMLETSPHRRPDAFECSTHCCVNARS
jgi:serine/threonine protein kinase